MRVRVVCDNWLGELHWGGNSGTCRCVRVGCTTRRGCGARSFVLVGKMTVSRAKGAHPILHVFRRECLHVERAFTSDKTEYVLASFEFHICDGVNVG